MRKSMGLAAVVLFLVWGSGNALEPAGVFLLVNKNVPESREVADHYCAMRGVPKENIVELDLPKTEDIGRKDFDTRCVQVLRETLKPKKEKVRVLLSTYGVPLRVGRPELKPEAVRELETLNPQIAEMQAFDRCFQYEISALEADVRDKVKNAEDALKEKQKERTDLGGKLRPLEQRRDWLSFSGLQEAVACFDSELTLLWWEEPELRGWQVNLLYFQVPEAARKEKPPIIMTARLDGPTKAIAMGLVDQAVKVEKTGLSGKVYVDARGIGYDPKADPGFGYGGYDAALREMAKLLQGESRFDVTLDDKPALFASGTCKDCALYCGWYSLANYVDCCSFVPGAVAYHIASSEAVSLRNVNSKQWCKSMLVDGVAATLGPVSEPYTIGFPKPAEFFGFLATGKYTLVECYFKTLLLNSWMTVLVGDPLYNPFEKSSKLKEEDVKPSPEGGRFILGNRARN